MTLQRPGRAQFGWALSMGPLDAVVEKPRWSDFGALGQHQCVLDVDAEVPHCALDLRVAEKDLHSSQVAGLLVDDRRFGPAERMRPVILSAQSDPGYPLVHEARILPGAHVGGVVDPAREGIIVERAASTSKPSEDAGAGRLKKLELNGPASLPLHDDCSGANPSAADEVANPDL